MKKIASLMMAIVMTFTIVACSQTAQSEMKKRQEMWQRRSVMKMPDRRLPI